MSPCVYGLCLPVFSTSNQVEEIDSDVEFISKGNRTLYTLCDQVPVVTEQFPSFHFKDNIIRNIISGYYVAV